MAVVAEFAALDVGHGAYEHEHGATRGSCAELEVVVDRGGGGGDLTGARSFTSSAAISLAALVAAA